MNQTLLQSTFLLDYPSASDSDFSGQDRPFSSASSFPGENVVEHHSSACSLDQPLVQHPDSLPVTNGLRYTGGHSAVHEVPPFHTANGLLVSPIDSSGESTSTSPGSAASSFAFSSLANVFPGNVSSTEGYPPTPVSVYSQAATYPQWNAGMSDYRPRVPALPLPLNMSPPSHSQGTSHSTQSLLGGPGRDSYPPPLNHASPRIPFSGHPNVHESMSRTSYPPRAIENPVTSTYSPTALYSHQNNAMMLDATGRQDQGASGAPPFGATQEHCLIYNSNRDKVKPDIQARIHKGFFKVDDKWTCYRRNYFSVQCSFSLQPSQVNSPLYVHRPNSTGLEAIQSFVITISAVVNGNGVDGDTRALIQHTPKRSKETEEAPKKIRISPITPTHGLNQNGTSGSMPYSFGGLPQLNGTKPDYDTPYGSGNPGNPGSQSSSSHTFERIQFQRATANNGKRRAQQQYYHVVVELYAEIARSSDSSAFGTLLKIATKLSAPMVVRGRSPGHYKDGRRDSSTSGMGGDGPSDPGDGRGGSILPPSMSGQDHISRYSLPSDQSGTHIGRGDYRGVQGVSFTTSPEDHSSSSSGGLEQDGLEDEDDPMDTSEVDRYIQHEYQAGPEVDLHGSATPMNGYRFQLPPVDFTRPPINSINEANTSFNIPFFSSNPHSARHQTPRPGERYPRHEYTYSPERLSHAPWPPNEYPRAPFTAAGSDGWNGNPYAKFEAVNSA